MLCMGEQRAFRANKFAVLMAPEYCGLFVLLAHHLVGGLLTVFSLSYRMDFRK